MGFSTPQPSPLWHLTRQMLALAEQLDGEQPCGYAPAAMLAVARILVEDGHDVAFIIKTIKHTGGLLDCAGLVVEGADALPVGSLGAGSWREILAQRVRRHGGRGGVFIGQGQPVNPMPNNEFLDAQQEQAIARLAAGLRSHRQAFDLAKSTRPIATRALRRSL